MRASLISCIVLYAEALSLSAADRVDPPAHWAFSPPVRPAVPLVRDAGWARSPMDTFLRAEQESRGLTPAPPASKAALFRRVTLDLKRRGLTKDVLVVFCTEFGRTPAVQDGRFAPAATGRDHHPHGFTVWLSGAGVRGGVVHGATEELGFHAVEHPHYVTDLHATVLQALGLDPRRLDVPGRKRLEIDYGRPIGEILL